MFLDFLSLTDPYAHHVVTAKSFELVGLVLADHSRIADEDAAPNGVSVLELLHGANHRINV
ncbi:MAG: hypothetical protein ACOX38_08615 [Bacillota bacterium]